MIDRHLPIDRQGCGLGDTLAFVIKSALIVVAVLLALIMWAAVA